MSNVNLKQVAERAGVSLATASRVLSGSDYPVAEELRVKVEQAADDLGYVPNAQAQGLLKGRTNTVGVVVGDVADPYFSQMIGGIHEAAAATGHLVTIMNTYRDPKAELKAIRTLHAQRVDIIIVAGSGLTDEGYSTGLAKALKTFTRAGGTAVVIGHHDLPDDLPLAHIHVEGTREPAVAELLHRLGHRKVALLTGDQRLLSTHDRIAAFRDVFGEGLVVREVAPTRDGGLAGAKDVLADHPEVTAIAATADQIALGALVCLREAGVQVPDQISVTGYNDIDISQDLVPALTSFHLPLWEAGRAAMECGASLTAGESREVRLECRLEERQSTAESRERND